MICSIYLVIEDHYDRTILSAHLCFDAAQRSKRSYNRQGVACFIERHQVTH